MKKENTVDEKIDKLLKIDKSIREGGMKKGDTLITVGWHVGKIIFDDCLLDKRTFERRKK